MSIPTSNSNHPLLSIILLFFFFFLLIPTSLLARNSHTINFRSPNLYPQALAWDPSAQHFLVGSLHQRIISAVSDAGVIETLISDPSLPENVTVSGLAVDSLKKRLLAVIHARDPLPPFNALAAYDLRSRQRLFLSVLDSSAAADDDGATRPIASKVAVDYKGNAYVTNSAGNYIWKVDENGEASIFSRSPQYTAHTVDPDAPYSSSSSSTGLNGIAYVSKGYLLVVQSSTGKMFKVDEIDGRAKLVLLNDDLKGAYDIAIRSDGVVFVVSPVNTMWALKSQDSWGEGVVYDKIEIDSERFPTSVVVGESDRVYVLYGHVNEGTMVENSVRESFSIQEMRSQKEGEDENVWIFVLIGFGLVYFLFWRPDLGFRVLTSRKEILVEGSDRLIAVEVEPGSSLFRQCHDKDEDSTSYPRPTSSNTVLFEINTFVCCFVVCYSKLPSSVFANIPLFSLVPLL
ncbi:SMP-30/Gluconolactonase/LRE-like region [Senna tora]|uniref:SMP-30/Gluconolactonase/LRE-like region n=1 Tax=Senna tora TaxID=362788 RepID=A0A834SXW2_9FABA|nr:SMP-30/Gluconolactonase/LRE-like region [Senna tora]